jgi:hypothetical protein
MDDADLQAVLSAAPFFQLKFTLRPGMGRARSFAARR